MINEHSDKTGNPTPKPENKTECINLNRLRCPDWKENIYYSIDRNVS
jgi:hypothetical protein